MPDFIVFVDLEEIERRYESFIVKHLMNTPSDKNRLTKEAEKKGLTGKKKAAYVGGAMKKSGVKPQGKKHFGRGRPLGS